MTVSGVGERVISEMTRDPVTTTASVASWGALSSTHLGRGLGSAARKLWRRTMVVPLLSATSKPVPLIKVARAFPTPKLPLIAGVLTLRSWSPGATICTPACRANSGKDWLAYSSGISNGLDCAKAGAEPKREHAPATPHNNRRSDLDIPPTFLFMPRNRLDCALCLSEIRCLGPRSPTHDQRAKTYN